MGQRKVALAFGEYFHVYNRGADKRLIFNDDADYKRFTELLYLSNTERAINIRDIREVTTSIFDFDREVQLVYIGAYCLMPNHFHILVTPARENGVQNFMQKLTTGYSMYFNKRYERKGTLFQGRYKSHHADSDIYLKYLYSYIHLNPVKLIQSDWKDVGIRDVEKTKKYLQSFQYSSLPDYLGVRENSKIIDPPKFPQYFMSKKEVDAELFDWLSYRELLP